MRKLSLLAATALVLIILADDASAGFFKKRRCQPGSTPRYYATAPAQRPADSGTAAPSAPIYYSFGTEGAAASRGTFTVNVINNSNYVVAYGTVTCNNPAG